MNLRFSALVAALASLFAFGIAWWGAEELSIRCTGDASARFRCTVQSEVRGRSSRLELTGAELRSASVQRTTTRDADGTDNHHHYLRLELHQGEWRSQSGDAARLGEAADALNRLIAGQAAQPLAIDISNRLERYGMALVIVAFAIVTTRKLGY